MIRLKTAVLLGGALKIGALLGGASSQDAAYLYGFGENLGIAFQLQDDILDVYGDPDKFGKQVGGDIISNKKTFLLLKATELADQNNLKDLNYWLHLTEFDNTEKVLAITRIYNQLDIRTRAELKMQEFADTAFNSLEKVAIPEANKQYLRNFADGLLVREH